MILEIHETNSSKTKCRYQQQQPFVITKCFMGWTQSSDGSTIQYWSALKTKKYKSWLHCIAHSKHEYWILQMSYALFNQLLQF